MSESKTGEVHRHVQMEAKCGRRHRDEVSSAFRKERNDIVVLHMPKSMVVLKHGIYEVYATG